MKRKNTIFILVAIFIAIVSFMLGAFMNTNFNIFVKGGSTTTIPQEFQELTKYTPITKEAPTEYLLNQSFNFGTWELRVSNIWVGDSVKYTGSLSGNYLLPPKNRKFVAIEIIIRNTGNTTTNDAILNAQIITNTNKKYSLLSITYFINSPRVDYITNQKLIPIYFRQYKLGIPRMDPETIIKRYLFFTILKDQTLTKLLLQLRTITPR